MTKEQVNLDETQNLSGKTLVAPTISGGIISGATLQDCAATADPVLPLDVATKQYVDGQVGAEVTTGDCKLTFKTTPDTSWIFMDDGTIGNAASGASSRANADTEPLFTLLWNNLLDIWAPVLPGGRGATASADFAANKTIGLPKMLGRAIARAGSGGGLTARSLGENIGQEARALTSAEVTVPGDSAIQGSDVGGARGLGNYYGASNHYHSMSYGAPFNIMQPTSFVNVMVKL